MSFLAGNIEPKSSVAEFQQQVPMTIGNIAPLLRDCTHTRTKADDGGGQNVPWQTQKSSALDRRQHFVDRAATASDNVNGMQA